MNGGVNEMKKGNTLWMENVHVEDACYVGTTVINVPTTITYSPSTVVDDKTAIVMSMRVS